MQSATDLAALGPGTLLIDYSTYVFSFLAVAGMPLHELEWNLTFAVMPVDGLEAAHASLQVS